MEKQNQQISDLNQSHENPIESGLKWGFWQNLLFYILAFFALLLYIITFIPNTIIWYITCIREEKALQKQNQLKINNIKK